MLYFAHYRLRPKRDVLRAKASVRRNTQRNLEIQPLILRLPQGGSGCPTRDEYRMRAKFLLILRLKQLYPEDPFLQNAPVSVAFFDQWFELEELGDEVCFDDILLNLTSEVFEHPENDPMVRQLRDAWLERQQLLGKSRQKYRVFVDGQVVGWLEAPAWDAIEIRGDWQSTINEAGKSFHARRIEGKTYDAVVEVDKDFAGSLTVLADGSVTFRAKGGTPGATGLA